MGVAPTGGGGGGGDLLVADSFASSPNVSYMGFEKFVGDSTSWNCSSIGPCERLGK